MPSVGLRERLAAPGVLASLLLWALSIPVLWQCMMANEAATGRGLYHVGRGAAGPDRLHGMAVVWGLLFVLLQLLAPLLLGFTLRVRHGWRTAVCVSISAGCSIVLDVSGLLVMLIWLRFRVGVG